MQITRRGGIPTRSNAAASSAQAPATAFAQRYKIEVEVNEKQKILGRCREFSPATTV